MSEPLVWNKGTLCIVCNKYSVSLCPCCYKPLCTLHVTVGERERLKGEFCKGIKEEVNAGSS